MAAKATCDICGDEMISQSNKLPLLHVKRGRKNPPHYFPMISATYDGYDIIPDVCSFCLVDMVEEVMKRAQAYWLEHVDEYKEWLELHGHKRFLSET